MEAAPVAVVYASLVLIVINLLGIIAILVILIKG